ncbi:MAG: hypothetical protein GAK30_00152 [Paracidovorax wautersii]|uniref:Uncharacterized protein n=1 Tax=Paracidovorax wautersii TaxID=1177982 RepID=A0A7V8FSN7_9BURK|nr:MAG: hypothetical protein GAK30_00152 [Paracidovorax wautersii]
MTVVRPANPALDLDTLQALLAHCVDAHGRLDVARLLQQGLPEIALLVTRQSMARQQPPNPPDWLAHYRLLQQVTDHGAALRLWADMDVEATQKATGLDYWNEAVWTAALHTERLTQLVQELMDRDSWRFAVRLAQFRNGNGGLFFPLANVIADALQRKPLPPNGLSALAWNLVLQRCDPAVPTWFEPMQRMLERRKLVDISSLLRTSLPANAPLFRQFALRMLAQDPAVHPLGPRATFHFLVLSYALLEPQVYRAVCARVLTWAGAVPTIDRQTPEGASVLVARNHLQRYRLAQSQSAQPSPGRLRIALCVSGQLRGYQDAFKTWEHLQLQDHDVHIHVHTWRSVGLSVPVASSRKGVDRAFTHPPFVRAFIRAGQRYGDEALNRAYPKFMAALAWGATVTPDDLRAVYGPDTHVGIEEDDLPEFAGDTTHQHKMFHKILMAHRLAAQSPQPYDLMIRIRPDLSLLPPEQPIDWHAIYRACVDNQTIYTGPLHLVNNLFVDDRIAIGSPASMLRYAETRRAQKQADEERWYGFPRGLQWHRSLAYSLFFQGLQAVDLPGILPGPLVGARTWDRDQIREALAADLPHGPVTDMDRLLTQALQ